MERAYRLFAGSSQTDQPEGILMVDLDSEGRLLQSRHCKMTQKAHSFAVTRDGKRLYAAHDQGGIPCRRGRGKRL